MAEDPQEPEAAQAPEAAEELVHERVDARPPGIDEARSWEGWRLDELSGARAGRVEGVYVDALTREPRWLVARMGRFGQYSAIPLALLAGESGRVWAPFDRALMRSVPQLEPGEPLTRELELELCRHFGIPHDRGRAAELTSRAHGATTAVVDSA